MSTHAFCCAVACLALSTATATAAAAAPRVGAPVTVKECEMLDRCSTWALRGSTGTGTGANGERETLSIAWRDDNSFAIHRTDTDGPSAGLVADYTGRVVGDRMEGDLRSSWPPHWDSMAGKWHATMLAGAPSPNAASAPVVANGADGTLVGQWGPVVFSFDDGRTVHGSEIQGAFNHVYEGRYVGPDDIDFTVTRIDPQGCKVAGTSHWHLLGKTQAKVVFDGWDGCGIRVGQVLANTAKASPSTGQVARQDGGTVATALLLLLLAAGEEDPPKGCERRWMGECMSQNEFDKHEREERMKEMDRQIRMGH